MDLFSYDETRQTAKPSLLADRMRPESLEEYIGQEHIVGPGTLLRRAIEADRMTSILLYGPPGSGKTTLAHIISVQTKARFMKLNAVDASVKDVRKVIEEAKSRHHLYGEKTILFLDEVHRFNKSQQDALLPAVEKGVLTLIGATTENPYHHVNGALLSRSTLFQLKPLNEKHSLLAMQRALKDEVKGLGFMNIQADERALQHIAQMANGDIRRALNALELAAMTTPPDEQGIIHITLEVAEQSVRKPALQADESTQYDVLSAFHKSIRGSSDAALFWALYGIDKLGMDPMIFFRRLTVACSEDIGLANPQAMVQAVTAMDAYEKIGWPEARYMLAQAVIFAVESPKSDSLGKAMTKIYGTFEKYQSFEVPLHLRDTHYAGAEKLGHKGYKNPHQYENHYVSQQYLPDPLSRAVFYEAGELGTEVKIRQNQIKRRQKNNKSLPK